MKILGTAAALVGVIALCGCDDNDSTPPANSGMGGTSQYESDEDAASHDDADANDGPDAATEQSLCAKYGGADAVASVVNTNIIGTIAADCRISTYFTDLTPQVFQHVGECLTIQVQELFGCDGVSYVGAESSLGSQCRSMADAHQGLGISKGDFDALIEDVVTGLTEAGVSADDIGAAAPALLGLEGDIVEDTTIDNTKAMCVMPDAGNDAGDAAN